MKLRFTINYRTEWGQQLVCCITYLSQDATERTTRLPMQTDDGEQWRAETAVVESRRSPVTSFTYIYKVEDAEGNELRREWALVPRTYSCDPSKNYIMDDQWRDLPLPFHLYSAAYDVTTHHPSPTPRPGSSHRRQPPRLRVVEYGPLPAAGACRRARMDAHVQRRLGGTAHRV